MQSCSLDNKRMWCYKRLISDTTVNKLLCTVSFNFTTFIFVLILVPCENVFFSKSYLNIE